MIQKLIPQNIYIGKRQVTKQGSRFLIYLPQDNEKLWQVLHEKKVKFEVLIIIPESEYEKLK